MNTALHPWQTASAAYFTYITAAAIFLPGIRSAARASAGAFSAAGFLLTLLALASPEGTVLRDWVLPPMLLLVAYRASGTLFTRPMPRVEQMLGGLDRALRIRSVSARLPRWAAECLELAYAAVYPMVPVGLALCILGRATQARPPDVDRFWTVVLLTDYVCFGALPWIRTRPPWQVETGEPWPSALRAINMRLLGAAGIRMNTFPSGHAAEALAVALLVADASAGLPVYVMLFGAAAVSAGAVFGRYHYALDAVAGWLVALLLWSVL
jgi:membrane-associated phospholipid phosphatase